jgi:probable addiction module antidote protein
MNEYKRDLLRDLKDAEYAAAYLSASYADSTEAFLIALRDVASARKGMTKLAREANVNRVNLYRMLSRAGNPGLENLRAIFDALNLNVTITARAKPSHPGSPVRDTRKSSPRDRPSRSR